jgi:hypothetical protein
MEEFRMVDALLEELRAAWPGVEWEISDRGIGAASGNLAHHEAWVKLTDYKIVVRRYDSPFTFPCNIEVGDSISDAVTKMQAYLKREAINDAW